MVRLWWNRAAQNLTAGGNNIGRRGLNLQVRKPPPSGSRRQHEDPVSISAVLAGFSVSSLFAASLLANREQARPAHVEVAFPQEKRLVMPAWLEVLLNLSGYAGFVALATRGAACPQDSADDEAYGSKR